MRFDREEALDSMTRITQANDQGGRLTLYAVVCPEHGGLITATAVDALNGAELANDDTNGEGPGCQYVALAITLDPSRMPEFPGDTP